MAHAFCMSNSRDNPYRESKPSISCKSITPVKMLLAVVLSVFVVITFTSVFPSTPHDLSTTHRRTKHYFPRKHHRKRNLRKVLRRFKQTMHKDANHLAHQRDRVTFPPEIEPIAPEALDTMTGPNTFKIMTFNLRYASANDGVNSWEFRKDHLIDIINRYRPVVMGTQEGLHDQLGEIHRRLTGNYGRFGIPREQNGEYEAIFYDQNIVEKVDGGNFWLSDNPERAGTPAWGAGCIRLTTWCEFRIRATNQHFFFFNTQLDHVSEEARDKSAFLIWKKIKQITEPHDAVFLVGDFNTYRFTPVYKFLTQPHGGNFAEAWVKSKKKIGKISYTYHGWAGVNKAEEASSKIAQMHIDWILFRPRNMEALKTEVITETRPGNLYPSDHYPIQAEFVFPDTSKIMPKV